MLSSEVKTKLNEDLNVVFGLNAFKTCLPH